MLQVLVWMLALNPAPTPLDKAVGLLEKTQYFALGRIGYAAKIADEETALKLIVSDKNHERVLERLIKSPKPQARLYGLLGLRWSEPEKFKMRAPKEEVSGEVKVFSGCIVSLKQASSIWSDIKKGVYDLPKEDDKKGKSK